MASSKGSTDQDIGRPGPWQEGRYQQKEKPADQSVRTQPGSSPRKDEPVSTPVTRQDYVFPDQDPQGEGREPPGGDAG